MYYNLIISIEGISLFLEDSEKKYVSLILASEDSKLFSRRPSAFEIKYNATQRYIKGIEWQVQFQHIALLKWIFKRAFSQGNNKTNFIFFSKLLELSQSGNILTKDFGMLGEILFACHFRLNKQSIIEWLSAKNKSFDFNHQGKLYEVKTSMCSSNNVLLHLSYNQVTLLGSQEVDFILIDMNGSELEIHIEEIERYLKTIEMPEEFMTDMRICLNKFKDLSPFKFNVLNYIGPKLYLKLDDKIINLKCKVKLDVTNDFVSQHLL